VFICAKRLCPTMLVIAACPQWPPARPRAERTADQLIKTIGLGSPGTVMAGWNQRLSTEEIASLATFIQHWDQIPANAIPQPPAQPIIVTERLLATGQTLYAQTCSRCHGVDGQGTRRAPALNVQTFFAKVTTDAAMIQIVTSGVPGTAMPVWGDRLSVSEIEAVVAYVRNWEQTAPLSRRRKRPVAVARRGSATARPHSQLRRRALRQCRPPRQRPQRLQRAARKGKVKGRRAPVTPHQPSPPLPPPIGARFYCWWSPA